MVDKVTESVNSIVAEALKNVGVAPRDIIIPPEPKPGGETPPLERKTKMDGSLKGQTLGEPPEEEETPPKEETTEPPEAEVGEKAGAPLSKADTEALIDQASSKFQSIMDRKINQLNLQMQQTITALNEFFQSQDDASLAGLSPEEQVAKRLERLEKGGQKPKIMTTSQPIEQQSTNFVQYLANFVDAVGLKIDDKRIDWAPDVNDPQTGFNRFAASIKKALIEDQTKVIQDLKDNGNKELIKIRKKTGVDKVSTGGAGGGGLPNIEKMTPFEKLTYAFVEAEAANKT